MRRGGWWLHAGLAVLAWLFAAAAHGAEGAPLVTILDGAATLVRGHARFELAEGVRLESGDIVATSDARLLRIEWPDGRSLNLGPATQLLLAPRFHGQRGRAAPAYLLQGWAKGNLALAGPVIDIDAPTGKAVVHALPDGAQVFTESGTVRIEDHHAGAAPLSLKPGEFFQRRAAARSVAPRPPAAFVAEVPRPFLDTLPARAALFASRAPAPRPLPPPAYADLQPWLDAEPALRRSYVSRWMPLARGEFRRALVHDLPAHREWEPVLFPERFQRPKPAAPARLAPGYAPASAPR